MNGSKKWLVLGVAALVAYVIVSSWPEIERYRRIRAM